jgi:hypothetical protein
MDLGQFSKLPEWDDAKMMGRLHKGDEWKLLPQLEKAKTLYNKWREIFQLVESFCETLQNSEEFSHTDDTKKFIHQNIHIVAPKLISAASVDSYVLKMENASIIRTNCREMMEQIRFAAMVGSTDEKYVDAIEEEMDHFKDLFKEWVSTFRKDDYEDEWGLYT